MIASLSLVHPPILLLAVAYAAAIVVALVLTWKQQGLTSSTKTLWTVALVLFPVLGLLVWLVFYIQASRRHAGRT